MPYASRASGPEDRADRAGMRDTMRAVSSMLKREHHELIEMGDIPYGPASSLGEEPYQAAGTALDYMCAACNSFQFFPLYPPILTNVASISDRYVKAGVRRSFMFEVFGSSTIYGLGAQTARMIGRFPSAVVSFIQSNSSFTRQNDSATSPYRVADAREDALDRAPISQMGSSSVRAHARRALNNRLRRAESSAIVAADLGTTGSGRAMHSVAPSRSTSSKPLVLLSTDESEMRNMAKALADGGTVEVLASPYQHVEFALPEMYPKRDAPCTRHTTCAGPIRLHCLLQPDQLC